MMIILLVYGPYFGRQVHRGQIALGSYCVTFRFDIISKLQKKFKDAYYQHDLSLLIVTEVTLSFHFPYFIVWKEVSVQLTLKESGVMASFLEKRVCT